MLEKHYKQEFVHKKKR